MLWQVRVPHVLLTGVTQYQQGHVNTSRRCSTSSIFIRKSLFITLPRSLHAQPKTLQSRPAVSAVKEVLLNQWFSYGALSKRIPAGNWEPSAGVHIGVISGAVIYWVVWGVVLTCAVMMWELCNNCMRGCIGRWRGGLASHADLSFYYNFFALFFLVSG